MLQESHSLGLDQLVDHIAEHCPDSIEAFISLTDVGEAHLVEEDFLDDEDGDGLAQLRAGLHDPET